MRHQTKSKIPRIDTLQSNTEPRHSLSQTRKSLPPLNKEETKYIQAVAGTLLYYARAVNPTIFPTLSAIGTKQATPTQTTTETIKQLLDYCTKQEEMIITYSASKMILCIHSDAGYCNEKNAQSRAGGHFFLSNNDQPPPPNHGAIMTNEQS